MNIAEITEEGIRKLLVEKGDAEALQEFDNLVAQRDAVFDALTVHAAPGQFTQGSVNSLLAEMRQICKGFDAVREHIVSGTVPAAPEPRM